MYDTYFFTLVFSFFFSDTLYNTILSDVNVYFRNKLYKMYNVINKTNENDEV